MPAPGAVRQNKLLLGDVDEIYVVSINYQCPSKADEIPAMVSKLVADEILNLTQLESNQTLLSVKRDHIGIIPVR